VFIWLFGASGWLATLMSQSAYFPSVKGVYCVMALLRERRRIKVGSLGELDFTPGVYVYVGSAMGGVEQRVDRHRRKQKKLRWHVDYLMEEAEYIGSVAVPSGSKDLECTLAQAIQTCEGVVGAIPGFGCSDCDCGSHLVYFGEADQEWVAEAITMRLSMLECVYPCTRDDEAWSSGNRQ